MEHQVILAASPKGVEAEVLFQKIAGLPLLMRNILVLKKRRISNIGLVLPPPLKERFNREIAPLLQKRGVEVELLAETPRRTAFPAHAFFDHQLFSPYFHFIIDSPERLKEAEKMATEKIRRAALGPVARHLNKKISLPISLLLAKCGIHPNGITVVNMILGMASGFFVAAGNYWGMLFGATLFQLASIFDGCDGEVAKLTFRTSKFGQYFDSISDNGALLSFFIGLIIATAKIQETAATVGLGLFLMVGLAGLLWQMILFLKRHTHSASLATFDKEYLSKLGEGDAPRWLIGFINFGKTLMRKDFFSLFFFGLAVIGYLSWALWMAIAGLWVANGLLIALKLAPAAVPKTFQE